MVEIHFNVEHKLLFFYKGIDMYRGGGGEIRGVHGPGGRTITPGRARTCNMEKM